MFIFDDLRAARARAPDTPRPEIRSGGRQINPHSRFLEQDIDFSRAISQGPTAADPGQRRIFGALAQLLARRAEAPQR